MDHSDIRSVGESLVPRLPFAGLAAPDVGLIFISNILVLQLSLSTKQPKFSTLRALISKNSHVKKVTKYLLSFYNNVLRYSFKVGWFYFCESRHHVSALMTKVAKPHVLKNE